MDIRFFFGNGEDWLKCDYVLDGTIYLMINDFCYPNDQWTDMCITCLDTWGTSWYRCLKQRREKFSQHFWFFEGYFYMDLQVNGDDLVMTLYGSDHEPVHLQKKDFTLMLIDGLEQLIRLAEPRTDLCRNEVQRMKKCLHRLKFYI